MCCPPIPACSLIADVTWLCSIKTSAPSLHSRKRSRSIPESPRREKGLRKARRNCASLNTKWQLACHVCTFLPCQRSTSLLNERDENHVLYFFSFSVFRRVGARGRSINRA